ncbi:hypothetical protein JCM5350_002521 [Sporobolomyces pararoseus]
MPSCHSTGFSSALCLPIITNNNDPAGSQTLRWIPTREFGISHGQDLITTTSFIQLPTPSSSSRFFRVYFQRDFKLLPPQIQPGGTSASSPCLGDFDNGVFAAFLTMNEPSSNSSIQRPMTFYKCFGKQIVQQNGTGTPPDTPPWFIEGQFSTEGPKTLNDLKDFTIELKICKATLKPGYSIGDGLIEPEAIQSIQQQTTTTPPNPVNPGFLTRFKFYYATREQLDLLGFGDRTNVPPPTTTTTTGGVVSGTINTQSTVTEPSLELLTKSNRILISLLNKDQKKRFVETIKDWKEIKEVTTSSNNEGVVVVVEEEMKERKSRIGQVWRKVLKDLDIEKKEEEDKDIRVKNEEGVVKLEETDQMVQGEEEDQKQQEDSVMLERRRSLRNRGGD